MSEQDPKCGECGHDADAHRVSHHCTHIECYPVESTRSACNRSDADILRAALTDANDQIRKLQDSANKRLDEYREVTGFLREVLDRLRAEALFHGNRNAPGGCLCPTCNILHRAEVMNLR